MKNKNKTNQTQQPNHSSIRIKYGQILVDTTTLNRHRPPESLDLHYVFFLLESNIGRSIKLSVN